MIPPWWSVLLTVIGVAGLYLVTRRLRIGFVVGVAVQVLWVVYAIVTRQWGFIASALAYGAVNVRGYLAWKEERHGRTDPA